jgi:ABC-type transport system involved in cytochrome bd biosynthesis fused ATPase/permease subunit
MNWLVVAVARVFLYLHTHRDRLIQTKLVIAHRLSTVVHADEIIVFPMVKLLNVVRIVNCFVNLSYKRRCG